MFPTHATTNTSHQVTRVGPTSPLEPSHTAKWWEWEWETLDPNSWISPCQDPPGLEGLGRPFPLDLDFVGQGSPNKGTAAWSFPNVPRVPFSSWRWALL